MAARQPQRVCEAMIIERSDRDSCKAERDGLEQHILGGMPRLQLDVATTTLAVLLDRARVHAGNHERECCRANGGLVKSSGSGFGAEIVVGEELDAMAVRDVVTVRAGGK
jgi:hypothetical protein